jgi:tripartite-type tricarboxylate transporter receptor subunit TctC
VKKILMPALEKTIQSTEVVHTIRQLGASVDYVPALEFKKMMAEEYAMVKQLLKTSGASEK